MFSTSAANIVFSIMTFCSAIIDPKRMHILKAGRGQDKGLASENWLCISGGKLRFKECWLRGSVYCVCVTVKLVFSVFTTVQNRVYMKKQPLKWVVQPVFQFDVLGVDPMLMV